MNSNSALDLRQRILEEEMTNKASRTVEIDEVHVYTWNCVLLLSIIIWKISRSLFIMYNYTWVWSWVSLVV